jgi:hypothetical protein
LIRTGAERRVLGGEEDIDISKLATKELQTLLKRIPKEINKRKQQEKARLVDDIAQNCVEARVSAKGLDRQRAAPGQGQEDAQAKICRSEVSPPRAG